MKKTTFKSPYIIATALLVLVTSALLIFVVCRHTSKTLNVPFSFAALKADKSVFNPRNVDTVWPYYLLENLSIGLIRDDFTSPSGYSGGLAVRWQQLSAKIWRFELKHNLRWSNGDPIQPDVIIDHLKSLKSNPGRHLQYIQKLENCIYNRASNSIDLHFSKDTDISLLHELSLADAGLVHPSINDWSVTSGPFFLDEYEIPEKIIHLKKNIYSPLQRSNSPENVKLIGKFEMASVGRLISESKFDLYSLWSYPFSERTKNIKKYPANRLTAVPSAIYLLLFNMSNKNSLNSNYRKELSSLVHLAFENSGLAEMRYENQLIPEGFDGRIKNYKKIVTPVNVLRNQTIVIDALKPLDELPTFFTELIDLGKKEGVTIVVHFRAFSEPARKDASVEFTTFVANQKDPAGSWSYFFSKGGPLEKFRKIAEPIFSNATIGEHAVKQEALLKLHRLVLDEAMLIPFFVCSRELIYSERIDISRINPFDLRLRFYEIQWQ